MTDRISVYKYVIVCADGEECPVISAKPVQHSKMVGGITAATPVSPDFFAISAGFFTMLDGCVCIGRQGSESLRLGPRPQDRDILQKFLFP